MKYKFLKTDWQKYSQFNLEIEVYQIFSDARKIISLISNSQKCSIGQIPILIPIIRVEISKYDHKIVKTAPIYYDPGARFTEHLKPKIFSFH